MTRVSAMPQDAFAPDAPQEEVSGSLWNVVRDAMAGRWLYATILGIVLGGGLATAGFLMTEPEYTAVGYVQISSRTDYVLEGIQEHQLADVDAFVNQQARLMQSEPVLTDAIRLNKEDINGTMGLMVGDDLADIYTPPNSLNELGWNISDGIPRYRSRLGVRTGRRNENLITVSYSSPIASEAYTAVQSLLAAYYTKFDQTFGGRILARRTVLEDNLNDLERQLTGARSDRNALLNNGILLGNPRRSSERAHDELERIDGQDSIYAGILARRLAGEEGETGAGAGDEIEDGEGVAEDAPEEFDAEREPTNRELDQFEPLLARQRAEVELLRQQYEQLKANYSPGFWRLDDALDAWTRARSDFEARRLSTVERWREEQTRLSALGGAVGVDRPILSESAPLEEIRAAQAALAERRADVLNRIEMITTDSAKLEEIEDSIRNLEGQIAVISDRVNTLRIEHESTASALRNQVIVNPAERPGAPSSDKRRKLAAVGLMGGLGVGFGLFFILGTLDRRAYESTQLRRKEHRRPFLGTIPDMEQRVDDEVDANALAASCVHQVRNRIDAVRSADEGLVLAVSSPQQGDGKTSVAVALGHSYARAGFSTILVDCDLIGEGLSLAMGLRDRVGIREALTAGRITNEIVADVAGNLSVLPCGSARGFGPESVRRASLMSLVRELRAVYDVVIVDSGPMPGSIESIPVAMSVDGVVVVIRRGRQQSVLDSCVEAIEATGTPCFGVVLNRARPADCERMVSASAISLPVEESRKRRLVLAGGAGEKLTSALGSEGDDFADMDGDHEGPR